MKQGDDPDDYFTEKTLARAELERIGEPISDRLFQEHLCTRIYSGVDCMGVKIMIYRDPIFDVDQTQSTMRHLYLDDLSRSNGAKGKIAGRNVTITQLEKRPALTAGRMAISSATNCWKKRGKDKQSGSDGNHHDNSRKNKKYFGKKDGSKAGSKGAAGQKWCSVHKTTTNSDNMCCAQGARRSKCGGANLASAVPSASSPPTNNDDDAPSLNFDDDFDKGFTCSVLTTASDGRISGLNSETSTMLVDSGASDHFMDEYLVPGLRQRIRGLRVPDEPKPIH